MKKIICILIVVVVAKLEINGQQQHNPQSQDEQIIINKKFNEKGDLTWYDSTALHTWKMDTAIRYRFPVDSLVQQWNFPGIDQFMNEFWTDSIFGSPSFPTQPFSFGFQFSPLDNSFGRQHLKPDSLFSHEFPFRFDSLFFDFNFSPSQKFRKEFNQKFMEDFEEKMNHYFNKDQNFKLSPFKNDKHRQEWEQLMEKHRQELENLRKKWQD